MRRPDNEALLADMLIAAREARAPASDASFEDFLDDRKLQLALEKLLENIGEAASRVAPEVLAALPELPWRDIVGMRHRLVHDHMNINLAKLWEVIERDLAPLIAAIEPLVAPERPPDAG